MSCNAWNHPLDCNCGFVGNPRSFSNDNFRHLRQLGAYPSRGLVSTYQEFTHSTTCPKCGGSCFFIRHNGGCVWVDELGPPWPRHACFITSGHSLLPIEPRCISSAPEQPNQELELLLDFVSTRDGYSLVVLDNRNLSRPLAGTAIPSIAYTEIPRLSRRPHGPSRLTSLGKTLSARVKESLRFKPVAIEARFTDGSSSELRVTSIAYNFLVARLAMISLSEQMLATIIAEVRPTEYAAYLNCHSERQPFYQKLLSGRPLSEIDKHELERLEQLALDLSSRTCTILKGIDVPFISTVDE